MHGCSHDVSRDITGDIEGTTANTPFHGDVTYVTKRAAASASTTIDTSVHKIASLSYVYVERYERPAACMRM